MNKENYYYLAIYKDKSFLFSNERMQDCLGVDENLLCVVDLQFKRITSDGKTWFDQ